MKKLFRLTMLCLFCLLLLLGTETFQIATETNAGGPQAVFTFAQVEPGVADVEVFGHEMTWNLTPLLSLRQATTQVFAALPAKLFGAICTFFESIFSVFA